MLWFRKLFDVTETTEEEVNDLDLEFRCEHCGHYSCDTKRGLTTHQRLHCGEARRERTEEEYTRSHITAVRGPPDQFRRFFQPNLKQYALISHLCRPPHRAATSWPRSCSA